MLKTITEDNSLKVAQLANDMRIKRSQIIQFVPNSNGTVSLFYWQDYEK